MTPISVYCDESGHLENDETNVMCLGAVWLPREKVPEVNHRIRDLKEKHGLKKDFELKWTKISPGMVEFYLDVVDYFFDDDDLHFRVVVIPDKSQLDHTTFAQDHDTWYFKMYFRLLENIVGREHPAHIYIDVKDTRSAPKIAELWDILSTSKYDSGRSIIQRLQAVRSDESQILQVSDLLIGAVAAENRGTTRSPGKLEVIRRVTSRSRRSLTSSTWPSERKFNVFVWDANYWKRTS